MAPAPRFTPQEQEKMVLQAAEECINDSSLFDFSMSSISKRAGLSMGSVYKHVQSKEDVLIALATVMFRNQLALFEKILQLPLTTPERIVAISLLDFDKVQTYSFDAQLDNLVSSPALLKRGSRAWLERMFHTSKATEDRFSQYFVDVAESGEFKSGMAFAEEVNIASWSLTVGYFQMVQQHMNWVEQGPDNPMQSREVLAPDSLHIRAMVRLLNAYEWTQPVTDAGLERVCEILREAGLR